MPKIHGSVTAWISKSASLWSAAARSCIRCWAQRTRSGRQAARSPRCPPSTGTGRTSSRSSPSRRNSRRAAARCSSTRWPNAPAPRAFPHCATPDPIQRRRSIARCCDRSGRLPSEAAFTADVLDRAAARRARSRCRSSSRRRRIVRITNPHGFAELRDGLERVVLDGIAFEHDGSPGRIVDLATDLHCRAAYGELWFGDAPYARIAELSLDGLLAEGLYIGTSALHEPGDRSRVSTAAAHRARRARRRSRTRAARRRRAFGDRVAYARVVRSRRQPRAPYVHRLRRPCRSLGSPRAVRPRSSRPRAGRGARSGRDRSDRRRAHASIDRGYRGDMTRRADKTTKAEKPKPKPRAPAKPPNKLPASKSAAALLAAIWANPKDADALRVYADWLIEQGSTRGEFIQLWLAENYEPANKLRKKYRGDELERGAPVRAQLDRLQRRPRVRFACHLRGRQAARRLRRDRRARAAHAGPGHRDREAPASDRSGARQAGVPQARSSSISTARPRSTTRR